MNVGDALKYLIIGVMGYATINAVAPDGAMTAALTLGGAAGLAYLAYTNWDRLKETETYRDARR